MRETVREGDRHRERARESEQDGVRNVFIYLFFEEIASMFFEDAAARLETQCFTACFASSDLFF